MIRYLQLPQLQLQLLGGCYMHMHAEAFRCTVNIRPGMYRTPRAARTIDRQVVSACAGSASERASGRPQSVRAGWSRAEYASATYLVSPLTQEPRSLILRHRPPVTHF